MTTEKQIAALIKAGADPVLISKMTHLPPAPPTKAAEPVEEEPVKERKGRRKGS